MSAISIGPPQEDELEDILRRTGAHAIPTGQVAGGASPAAIPTAPDASQAIPTDPGMSGDLPNSHPLHKQAGVASLWSRADNIHNPVLRVLGKIGAGLARGIDVAGSIAAPGVAAMIPGSTLNNDMAENRQRKQASEDTVNQERQAVTQHTQAETAAEPQKVALEDRKQTLAEQTAGAKPDQMDIQHQYAAAVQEAIDHGQEPAKSPKVQQLADAITSLQKEPRPAAEGSPERQTFDSLVAGGAAPVDAYRKLHPEKPPSEPGNWQMGVDGQGQPILYNSKTAEVRPAPQGIRKSMPKPSADEQRRGDLAENLNENLSTLEDIINRRPELFGPLHGRITSLKAAVGTDDPDIAALETIKHQLGMAQISAHGMRSAHGIDAAAASIVNSFHNSPEAVRASINAARNSVATFTQDVENAKSAGGAQPQAPKNEPQRPANVPEGYIFKANGPKGKGWYRP